ncbi:MAG: DUF1549 and DUF1553 domain-containing protein [Planctomycetota bacterium]|nr:DUF1549 and DUF1553 domain-containing protein [Planctomycetota bacterium]
MQPSTCQLQKQLVLITCVLLLWVSWKDSAYGQNTKATEANISFRNDVLPVLSKLGCNSGACHGALAGKGGFRLSLRGFDPVADHFNIAKQARGRRVEFREPAKSLLLTKPTAAVPHQGGVRFNLQSEPYRIISRWIAEGAKGPNDSDDQLEKILFANSSSKRGLKVNAHYSSGKVRDVTRWVKFSSTDETIVKVSDNGVVEEVGYGQGAITAWYDSQIAVTRLSLPFPNQLDPEIYATAARTNFIDERVLEQLQHLNLEPSPRCDDPTFIRRAFLDTIGILPTTGEVIKFVTDQDPNKRTELIEHLLDRPEFTDLWTYHWSDVLLINGTRLRPGAVKAFYQWVRGHVENNTPWDQFTREILTAQGNSLENGATNFYALHQDPQTMAENASQAFLGLSIECAKCHNHPLEKWTNDQYYAFANLFSRVRAKGWGGDGRNGDGKRNLVLASVGELIQPNTGKPQPPRPLDGSPLPKDFKGDRRVPLADWMVSPNNPYFTRAITNRIWAKYFGIGLVEPVDDLRFSNPVTNEHLLEELSVFLVQNQFNLKALMRLILQSETYQRSSATTENNQGDHRYFSHYYPKRLQAEILLDAISEVTQVPTPFEQIAFPGADNQKTDFYSKGTRAVQLYDSAVASYFLKTFGRNQREITCECERTNETSMVQVLHISNGDTLNQKLASKENRLKKLLDQKLSDRELIQQAYLICLARKPSEATGTRLQTVFKESKETKRTLLEDLFWSLVSSREFMFNH